MYDIIKVLSAWIAIFTKGSKIYINMYVLISIHTCTYIFICKCTPLYVHLVHARSQESCQELYLCCCRSIANAISREGNVATNVIWQICMYEHVRMYIYKCTQMTSYKKFKCTNNRKSKTIKWNEISLEIISVKKCTYLQICIHIHIYCLHLYEHILKRI